jgi:hypothetical protein
MSFVFRPGVNLQEFNIPPQFSSITEAGVAIADGQCS